MKFSGLVYDLEIIKAINRKSSDPEIPGVAYCGGWHDHANMGISVIGAYDFQEERYRVFLEDNFVSFHELARSRKLLIGFNSIPFDNAVLRANGIDLVDALCYDLLRETWAAAGLGPEFRFPTHAGYSLDAICTRNFGSSYAKEMTGDQAPVLWQQGKRGQVIDYCLNDNRRTVKLFEAAMSGSIVCPKTGRSLTLRKPEMI